MEGVRKAKSVEKQERKRERKAVDCRKAERVKQKAGRKEERKE
jgi:hypothetical protein